MVSMKDIAQRCGVSVATVSKALNGQQDIGEDTRRRICIAAEKMGYMTNSAARALKTNRTYNLGVLFVDERHSGLAHEYFSAVLESFKAEAEAHGYDITFLNHNVGGKPTTYLQHCRYRGLDGVVIACVDFNHPQVQELVDSGLPLVTIDHVFNNRLAVTSDNLCGTEALGLEAEPDYVRAGRYHDPECCARETAALLALPQPPTCILFPDDFSAIGGLNTIAAAGLRVPDDISVAGYDGIYLSQTMSPRLTTYRQDTAALGRTAAARLIELIEKPRTTVMDRTVVTGALLPGGTVASPRTE